MKAWFVSDIHIKQADDESALLFRKFLYSLGRSRDATHLFLVGDIFDLWVGGSDYFFSKFRVLADEISYLKDRNIEVHYFEGNHDVHIDQFWKNKGVKVWTGSKLFKLGDWKVVVEHGDFINPNDKVYLRYLEIIRKSPIRFLALNLPGFFWDQIGSYASKKSRKISSKKREVNQDFLRELLRNFAKEKSKKYDFDYIITGHIHVKDEYLFNKASGRKVHSVNLGSWLQQPVAYCLDDFGGSFEELNQAQ
jgi:UDP-2,3-diacylglucosamine hydrolase